MSKRPERRRKSYPKCLRCKAQLYPCSVKGCPRGHGWVTIHGVHDCRDLPADTPDQNYKNHKVYWHEPDWIGD